MKQHPVQLLLVYQRMKFGIVLFVEFLSLSSWFSYTTICAHTASPRAAATYTSHITINENAATRRLRWECYYFNGLFLIASFLFAYTWLYKSILLAVVYIYYILSSDKNEYLQQRYIGIFCRRHYKRVLRVSFFFFF